MILISFLFCEAFTDQDHFRFNVFLSDGEMRCQRIFGGEAIMSRNEITIFLLLNFHLW